MNLMKYAMIFAISDKICGERKFYNYAAQQLHVLLGLNALGFSYVSGEGENSMKIPICAPPLRTALTSVSPDL